MKLRLKLKFVDNKLFLDTRYGFFYILHKFTCRSLRQPQFGVTEIILVSFLNFEQIWYTFLFIRVTLNMFLQVEQSQPTISWSNKLKQSRKIT